MKPFRKKGLRRPGGRPFGRTLIVAVLLSLVIGVCLLGVLHFWFSVNSGNAVVYLVRDSGGRIRLTRDLRFDEGEKLVFMLDGSILFRGLERGLSVLSGKPYMSLVWDAKQGSGMIREVRPDGTKFLVVLSRFQTGQRVPRGIFIGGDLPYGDAERWRDLSRSNTGMAYYDGHRWRHIWCSINEGVTFEGTAQAVEPSEWRYLGSRVVKADSSEVLLWSMHDLSGDIPGTGPVKLRMARTLSKRSGDDYVVLRVDYINVGQRPLSFNYTFGDEPWIGEFGDSSGDVGWTAKRVFYREGFILPVVDSYAGFWDAGNAEAGETGEFTGFANFIEWMVNPPAIVYFSNTLELEGFREGRLLDSRDNRVINLVWFSEYLRPKEAKSFVFALGMAKPGAEGQPVKPEVEMEILY